MIYFIKSFVKAGVIIHLIKAENCHLVDRFLHLHQTQVGKVGLDHVDDGLQIFVLHDQQLVAPHQTQAHLKDGLQPLEEQRIWAKAKKVPLR